jgi:hypothetical protein
MKLIESNSYRNHDPLRDATGDAIARILEPLLDLMVDLGMTVQELNLVIRERAIRNATRRVVVETGRESISRVAIETGIPRADVARVLRSREKRPKAKPAPHPARRVLAAWYEDNRFLNRTGEPATLPIFGQSASFEHLVHLYSSGTPVRAMLDELTRINAVERLSDQRVHPKARYPILTELSPDAIGMIGDRAADLIATLLKNARGVSPPLFEATVATIDLDSRLAGFLQREINQQASSFIGGVNALLNRTRVKKRPSGSAMSPLSRRAGVTVFYFEDGATSSVAPKSSHTGKIKRQNLRRGKARRS